MPNFLTASIGSLPRIGDEKDEQRHRRGLAHLTRKDISAHAFRDVEQSVVQDALRDQAAAGLDEVTDGLIGWNDPISHFCSQLSNIKFTGLARYFDTNTYYRCPLITGRPDRSKPVYLPAYQFAAAHSSIPVRTVITGPYTLARHTRSSVKATSTVAARVDLFTKLLLAEIDVLIKNGAKIIQIDEPAIGRFPADVALLKKAIEMLTRNKPTARFILAVYFSPLADLYDKLSSFPVDVLNLDFTYDGKKLLEAVFAHPPQMALGFGLVDARSTRMENADELIEIAKR
jgi:5-methyltetrahydropteroyltriglutamate--homocysteine methyltransferase